MFSFIRPRSYHLTLLFQPNALSCAAFTYNRHKKRYALHAYESYPMTNGALGTTHLQNITDLKRIITAYMKANQIQNTLVHMVLNKPFILSTFVYLTTSNPTFHDIHIPDLERMIWFYQYLYTTEEGLLCFYITGMTREQLFMYQLLALYIKQLLASLTSHDMALLSLYRYQQGAAFRHSTLGVDLARYQHATEQLIRKTHIHTLIDIPTTIHATLLTDVVPHIGACIQAMESLFE